MNKRKLKLLPQVKEAIQILNENDIDIHIITNQSGINRGVYIPFTTFTEK